VALTARCALVALLAALVLAVAPGWSSVAVLDGGLALLVLADLAVAAPVRRLRITRSGATSGRQGEPAEVHLTVRNGSARVGRLLVRDGWPPSAGSAPRVHRLLVPGRQQRQVTTVLTPWRRGDRRPGRLTVRSLGPLGLAGRQGRHVAPWCVRVLPPFTSRRYLPARLERLRQIEGLAATRGPGAGTELEGLREYVPGDDSRRIDWRSSARREVRTVGLAVRTYRPERDRTVLVAIDTGRTAAARVGDVPRLDSALDAALLLTALAGRAGDRVRVLAYDAVLRAHVDGGGEGGLATVVQAMALLEPALVEPDHTLLVRTLLSTVRVRSLVVLLTDLNASALEEGLLPVLGALTSRHVVLLAAVSDPEVEALARGRLDVDAVYDAAAAERARTERRRISTELRRLGVEVVDAPADVLPAALADTYLALKAAGRL